MREIEGGRWGEHAECFIYMYEFVKDFQKETVSTDEGNVAFGKLINTCTSKHIIFNPKCTEGLTKSLQ